MSDDELHTIIIDQLDDADKDILFEMYAQTYTNAGQSLWFREKNELFGHERYKCITTYKDKSNMFKTFIIFQFKTKFNKISVVAHNGSSEGKEMMIKLLKTVLSIPGYVIEASDAMSWVLRKAKIPIIDSKHKIEEALDIQSNDPNDVIVMNDDFDYSNKNTQQYTRIFRDVKKQKIYESKETLFGTNGCVFNSPYNCNRECVKKSRSFAKKHKTSNSKIKRKTTKRKYLTF